jgi:hypothetical protein
MVTLQADDLARLALDVRKTTQGQAKRVALTRAELIRAVLDTLESAAPTIDADGPALVPKAPLTRIERKCNLTLDGLVHRGWQQDGATTLKDRGASVGRPQVLVLLNDAGRGPRLGRLHLPPGPADPARVPLICVAFSDQLKREDGGRLTGPGFLVHYEGESTAVIIARCAYSRGLRPLRAR